MNKLILKAGREKSLKRRHPWVFSGAIARIQGHPAAGDTVELRSSSGEPLAVAAYSPKSQIVARVWDWKMSEIDRQFFETRVKRATEQRLALRGTDANHARRLVNGESDGLPGVVADQYGDTIVVQLSSAGADRWRDAIADALLQVHGVARVWERSDAEVRNLEGLAPALGILRGPAEPTRIVISENGLRFEIDFVDGHKTGFYLDQCDNRRLVREMAAGCDVLDGFCYSGGFALNAAAGGARSVMAADSSAEALGLGQRNGSLNSQPNVEWVHGDVFQLLRKFRDAGRAFDLIVLDPPKFAPTAAHVPRAARAYKDINLLAFKLLRPGGSLVTFSCSGGVSVELFQKIIAGAALDAGVDAQILRRLGAAADHPVAISFPEGEYLKGLVCRIAS